MATDKQTFIKDLRPFGGGTPIHYDIDTAISPAMCSGELAAWDGSNRTLIRMTRPGPASSKYVGITGDSLNALGSLGNQAALLALVKPFKVFTTGVHQIVGTAAQTYKHGTAVYMGADTQTISTDSSGSAVQIGTVHAPDGTVYSGAVLVPVLIDQYTLTQL